MAPVRDAFEKDAETLAYADDSTAYAEAKIARGLGAGVYRLRVQVFDSAAQRAIAGPDADPVFSVDQLRGEVFEALDDLGAGEVMARGRMERLARMLGHRLYHALPSDRQAVKRLKTDDGGR